MVLCVEEQRTDQLPAKLHKLGHTKILLCTYLFLSLFIFNALRCRWSIHLCLHMTHFCISVVEY